MLAKVVERIGKDRELQKVIGAALIGVGTGMFFIGYGKAERDNEKDRKKAEKKAKKKANKKAKKLKKKYTQMKNGEALLETGEGKPPVKVEIVA